MSLIAWYPLNGNLNNQGVGENLDLILSNGASGLASNDAGKIGKCYERTAHTADLLRSKGTIDLNGDITMSCWAYVTATPGDSANGLVTAHSHADNTGVGITVKQVSTSDYRISCNTGTGSSRTFHTYYGTTNIKNAWHHLALTYDKTTKQLLLYVNGKVEYTLNNYSNASKVDYIDIFNWSTTHYTNANYRPLGKLNDVRIYDHCLSQREVREIAKGLVLHYPMNQCDGVIGGRNFYQTSPISWTDISIGQWASTTRTIPMSTLTGYGFKNGDWLTCSMDLKSSNDKPLSARVEHYNTSSDRYQNISSIHIQPGVEERSYISFQLNTSYTQLNIMIQNATNVATTTTEQYKCIKLESGKIATPYTPAPEDTGTYDDNIVYDCSGYGHSGIINTGYRPSWSSDNMVGQGSYNFADNKKIVTPTLPTAGLADSYTIAWWANASTLSSKMFWGFSDGNRLNYYSGLYNNTGDGSSNPFQKPGTTTTITVPGVDVWHHYAMTGDGSSSKLYVDGVHYGTAKIYKPITGTTIYLNGWSSGTDYCFNGLMNDFRIYATALSAADVKDLYETRMSVADNGVFFCTEFIEPDDMMGGRNLALNSGAVKTISVPTTANTTWGAATNIGGTITSTVVPYGSYCTCSVDICPTVAATVVVDFNNYSADSSVASWSGNDNDLVSARTSNRFSIPANIWTRISWTTKNEHASNTSKAPIYIVDSFGCLPQSAAYSYQVKNIKCELGSMATPWCPALEDYGVEIGDTTSHDPQFFSTGLAQAGLVETNDKQMKMTDYHIGMEQLIEW